MPKWFVQLDMHIVYNTSFNKYVLKERGTT